MLWAWFFFILMLVEDCLFGQRAGWPDDLWCLFAGASVCAFLVAKPWKKAPSWVR